MKRIFSLVMIFLIFIFTSCGQLRMLELENFFKSNEIEANIKADIKQTGRNTSLSLGTIKKDNELLELDINVLDYNYYLLFDFENNDVYFSDCDKNYYFKDFLKEIDLEDYEIIQKVKEINNGVGFEISITEIIRLVLDTLDENILDIIPKEFVGFFDDDYPNLLAKTYYSSNNKVSKIVVDCYEFASYLVLKGLLAFNGLKSFDVSFTNIKYNKDVKLKEISYDSFILTDPLKYFEQLLKM